MAALDPDRVLAELGEVWASLAGDGDAQGVMRACSLTLAVIVGEEDSPAQLGVTLAEVMQTWPHRAIVVRVRPDTAAVLEHRVTAQCWLPAAGRKQICCEQIEITASDDALTGLASVLVALRAPDLPFVVWYRTARLAGLFPLDADKIIVDGFASAAPVVGDLAWTRITGWRQVVARAFDNEACRALLPRVDGIRVFHGGAEVPADARYLGAWARNAIGREVAVSFETVAGEGIDGIAFTGADISFRRAGRDAVLIRAGELLSCAGLSRRSEASLLVEELGIFQRDPVYHSAMARA